MEIFVTGATGAVGRPLVEALAAAGHQPITASRQPSTIPGAAEHVLLDLDTTTSPATRAAMDRADVAYYLVHALGDPDFAAIDRRRAIAFAELWGPDRPVVYLGGLGDPGAGSAHLRSRHEVGDLLRSRCRTVELRASLVLGASSLSFQLLTRLGALASRWPLPVVAPTAATARTQPIGQHDLIRCLLRALDVEPGSYDIGGPDVIRYADLIELSADVQGRKLVLWPLIPVPPDLIGPLSALLARVDPWATTSLFAGMGEETVVHPIRALPGPNPARTPLREAIAQALNAA